MSFTGTLDKCSACDKTVYVVDSISVDGVPYHKTCFKCSHCKGTLQMSNYSSMDGVLYCKTHFEQLFKETGSFTKNFQNCQKEKNELSRAPSKLSAMFCGTQDKCATCHKTAYPLEKITVEGESYHKTCFRCAHGGCALTPSSYAALDGFIYCKHHFAQLFKEKGSYNYLIKATTMRKNAAAEAESTAEAEAEGEAEAKPEAESASEEVAEAEPEAGETQEQEQS